MTIPKRKWTIIFIISTRGPLWTQVAWCRSCLWQMRNLFRCEHTAPRFDMTVLQCCKLIPLLEPPKKIIRKVGTEKTWSITSWMNLSVVSAGARQWNLRFLDETPTFCCFQWVKQLSGSIFGDGRRTDRWGQPQVTMAQNWCQRKVLSSISLNGFNSSKVFFYPHKSWKSSTSYGQFHPGSRLVPESHGHLKPANAGVREAWDSSVTWHDGHVLLGKVMRLS